MEDENYTRTFSDEVWNNDVSRTVSAQMGFRKCAQRIPPRGIYQSAEERALGDDADVLQKQGIPPLRIVALVESNNAFASVANIQHRSVDTLTKLTLGNFLIPRHTIAGADNSVATAGGPVMGLPP